MSIGSRIREGIAAMKERQQARSYKENMVKAERLQKLKTERVKAEGKARLEKKIQAEQSRIRKAKEQTSTIAQLKGLLAARKKAARPRANTKAYRPQKAEEVKPTPFTLGPGNGNRRMFG